MPVRIAPFAITLLALVGVALQGPILCALACLGGVHSHNALASLAARSTTLVSSVRSASADLHVVSHNSDQSATSKSGAVDCRDLGDHTFQTPRLVLADVSAVDALFHQSDDAQPLDRAARLHAEPLGTPHAFVTDPLDHPPTT